MSTKLSFDEGENSYHYLRHLGKRIDHFTIYEKITTVLVKI